MLLEAGADPTLTKKDRTNAAMLVAAGQANSGYLGPGPDAAISATLEALKMCVDRGVDLNAFNTAGQTAMHVAAGRGLDPVVKFLADNGAKLDRTDKQGRTPLDVALGVGGGAARGNNRGPTGPRESTAALLRQLMSDKWPDECVAGVAPRSWRRWLLSERFTSRPRVGGTGGGAEALHPRRRVHGPAGQPRRARIRSHL